MGILWLPACHVLSWQFCGPCLPPTTPSLSFFSFRRGLKRTLLPGVGVGGVRGSRGDWQGVKWYRFSTKGEKVDRVELDVFSATIGQVYAVLAACPEWASVSTASKCEELDQHR